MFNDFRKITMWMTLGIILLCCLAYFAYWMINGFRAKALRTYGYDFFSKSKLYAYGFAIALGAWGYLVYAKSPERGLAEANLLYWMTLVCVSAVILIAIVAINVKRTNAKDGAIGSVLQIVVLLAVIACGLVSMVMIVIPVALLVALSRGGSNGDDHAPFAEQQREYEAWMASDLNKDSPNYRFKNDRNGGY